MLLQSRAVLFSLVLAMLPPAVHALAESEPNNTSGTADVVAIAQGAAVLVSGDLAPGDVDYFAVTLSAREVLSVMTAPLLGLLDRPDTEIFVFDTDGSTELLESDDAGEDFPEGDEYGSVMRFYAGDTGGTFFVKVRGCCGDDHDELGPYALVMSRVVVNASTTLDTEPDNNDSSGADDTGVSADNAAVIVAALDIGSAPDVDYFAVQLTLGQVLFAMTAPVSGLTDNFNAPNTFLEVVDQGDNVFVDNDDAGRDLPGNPDANGSGSAVRFRAPADGTFYLRVTPSDDVGTYFLTLAVVSPATSTIPALSPTGLGALALLLLLTGWLAMVKLRR